MQQISSNYKNEIKQPSRHFECRVTIGKNIYTNESIVDIILDYPQAIDGFSIGNTTSQSLDLTLLNTGEEIYSTNQIKVEIGLQVGSAFEYILMGYYNVDEVSKNDYTIKFTAFDNMMKFETPYFSSLGDKPTLQQVVNELATITGISFVGSIPSYTVTKLDGYTCREVLSYVASLCGGNALITRDGKFTIKTLQVVDCSVTTETHFGLTTEEVPYKLGKITCVVDSEIELSKGATGIDSMELSFENPWMTESILNTLYQQLNGFSYLGFQTKWQGDLALNPYDLILIQDKKGTSHRVPILNQKFTYVGGLTSEIAAKGESKNKNSFSSSGPNANKTNRIVTEQAIIKEALINKANIQDLEAVSIRTQSLEATTAKIQDAIIDVAHISDLNAVNAKIESLQATDVTIQNAIINKADISELNAAVANINILNADLGVIKHLVNGNLSSENIQAGGITSDKLTIANGFIKDAMIDSLNANKITAGQINTALVQVSSASGNLVINDNTIQIRDVNRVRVQIGKDASNDYSMSVWDSSGKLMFDARGLKADAIKDSIIRDDMVAPGANIDGSKLNISSVVSSINNSSSTLKASKVEFDGIAQTLEVAFNALKVEVDGVNSKTESNTTAINVAQGKINTLIQDTTITKNGQTIKLKDEYSRLEQTVSGLNSTVGAQQTIIDANTGKITATNSELSSLKQNVNGLSASISTAQTTLQNHTTQINNKADLSVVDQKIDNIQIGGRNLVLRSSEVFRVNHTELNKDASRQLFLSDYLQDNKNLIRNKYITFSVDVKTTDLRYGTTRPWVGFELSVEGSENQWVGIGGMRIKEGTTNGFVRYTTTVKINDMDITGLRLQTLARDCTGTVELVRWKIEIGSKDTDYSLAPEDVQSSIDTKANITDVYNKTEVYTKAQTDSQINIAKDAINLGVSTTYETKANVESKATVTLNSAKSYADTKKQEAINSASTDATNKVNSAKTELNAAIGKKANSADVYTKTQVYTKDETNSQINIAKEAINLGVSNTYETKTNVETKINGVTIGGTNLLLNSHFDYDRNWSKGTGVTRVREGFDGGYCMKTVGALKGKRNFSQEVSITKVEKGQQYTATVWLKTQDVVRGTTNPHLYLFASYYLNDKWVTECALSKAIPNGTTAWTKYVLTFTMPTEDFDIMLVEGYARDFTGTIWWDGIKLEKGNKASDWSPSPLDISTDITNAKTDAINTASTDATNKVNSAKSELNTAISKKANVADVYSKVEVYTKGQTDSAIKVAKDAITQSVSSAYETKTDAEAKINGVNTSISNLTNRVNSAEQKITDTAITNTVKKNFYTKTEAENAITSKGYQTSSQVQQTVDGLQIKFSESGGYNLFLNSSFRKGTSHWETHSHNNPTGGTIGTLNSSAEWGFPNSSVNCAVIRLSNQSNIEYGIKQTVKTTIGKKYTLSFYYAGHRLSQANAIVRRSGSGNWLANKHINSFPSGGNSNINNWNKCSLSFIADGTNHTINIVITNANNDGYLWIAQPQVVEGDLDLPYSTNPNEIYDGITTIDKDGINVATSYGSHTQFHAGGMSSYNNSGQRTLGIENGGISFHAWNNNALTAYITQSSLWGGSQSANGLAISTTANGTYLALGTSSLSDVNTTLNMDQALTISAIDSFQPIGINFWKDVHAHGYGIRQLSHLQLAGSGAIQFDYLNNSPSTIYEAVNSGHSLYVMGGYQMHLGCMDGKGVPKGVIWMQSSTNTHSYTHWDFHNYTMYNMKTASTYANYDTRRISESYGVTSNVDGVRYLYKNVELVNGKAIRSIPLEYKGCEYDIVSIVCKGRGSAWVETEGENRFEIQGDCLSVNVEIIIYPADDVMMLSTVNAIEAPVLELPEVATPEIAPQLTNEGVSSCDFWNQYMYSKYLFNLKKVTH